MKSLLWAMRKTVPKNRSLFLLFAILFQIKVLDSQAEPAQGSSFSGESQYMAAESMNPITISSIEVSGDACPEGSYSITLAPDFRSYTILFDQAVAESRRDISQGGARYQAKYCQIYIVTEVSEGFQTQHTSQQLRGFTDVKPGSEDWLRLFYYRLNNKNKFVLAKKSVQRFGPNQGEEFFLDKKYNHKVNKNLQHITHEEHMVLQVQLIARSISNKQSAAQIVLDSVDGTVGVQPLQNTP